MSAPVLLNFLNELSERDKCLARRAFYRFFANSLTIYREPVNCDFSQQ